MKLILNAAVCLVVSLSFDSLHAQSADAPKLQLGLSVGTFIYQGDLTPSAIGSYRTVQPMVNLFIGRLFSPAFSARINLALGRLKGDESTYKSPAYRQQRNFSFSSPVAEITGIAEWNILGRNYTERGLAPYVFAGAGLSFLNSQRDYSRLNAAYFSGEEAVLTGLNEDVQQRTPGAVAVFPVGAGARYYLNDRIGLSVETSYRIISTDYLDGFSLSANPSRGDHYYSHSVGIVYRLGQRNRMGCPVVSY